MRAQLLKWQWDGYPEFHRTRRNLLIHIVAVPAFISSLSTVMYALVMMQWALAAVGVVGCALAFGVQGFGHSKEPSPAIPFDGPSDVVTRIFAEQLITFPRFVLSGGWWRALRDASSR